MTLWQAKRQEMKPTTCDMFKEMGIFKEEM